jgi:hypothetical protein
MRLNLAVPRDFFIQHGVMLNPLTIDCGVGFFWAALWAAGFCRPLFA